MLIRMTNQKNRSDSDVTKTLLSPRAWISVPPM
jgi:hypothetical protein